VFLHLVLLQTWPECSKTHKVLKEAFSNDVLGQKQTTDWFN